MKRGLCWRQKWKEHSLQGRFKVSKQKQFLNKKLPKQEKSVNQSPPAPACFFLPECDCRTCWSLKQWLAPEEQWPIHHWEHKEIQRWDQRRFWAPCHHNPLWSLLPLPTTVLQEYFWNHCWGWHATVLHNRPDWQRWPCPRSRKRPAVSTLYCWPWRCVWGSWDLVNVESIWTASGFEWLRKIPEYQRFPCLWKSAGNK